MLPPTTRELDACGIGFVADAQRPLVPRHRRRRPRRAWRASSTAARSPPTPGPPTGRGSWCPSPRRCSATGTGVAVLFVRGDDPRPAVEAAAAAERLDDRRLAGAAARRRERSASWPAPPLRTSCRSCSAAGAAPTVPTWSAGRCGCAGASSATTNGTYVASCSFRTMVYKGLAAADALADFYLDLADERFAAPFADLPPALLDQHAADLGARPAVPHAVPQRRDQRPVGQREPHAGPGRARHRAGRPRRRGAVPSRCSTPSDSDSGKLDAAVELLVRGGPRHPPRHGHARARGVGERPRPRPRGARLLPLPLGPDGAVGRPGRRRSSPTASASAPASTATACARCATQVCEDGFVACCSEVGAVDVSGHGQVPAGPARPGPDAVRRPDPGLPRRPRLQGADRRRRALRPLGRRRLLPPVARASRRWRRPTTCVGAPGRCTGYTKEELAMVLQAHGRRRQRAHVLDGRRLAAAQPGAAGPGPCTTTCASASPRSPTRPSTRCASGW